MVHQFICANPFPQFPLFLYFNLHFFQTSLTLWHGDASFALLVPPEHNLSYAMDRKAGLFSDLKGNKGNVTLFCFQPTMSTSSGIWLKDHPLDYSFPLLLAQMSIIFVASRLTHAALRPLGIPQVISHTIAGIILGPSCLCQSRRFQETIFPLRSWVHLDLVSQLAFILFIFVVGVKTDLSLIRRSGRKALCVAAIGTVLPYVVIIAAAVFHPGIIGDAGFGSVVTNLASCWAITSNTVVSCLLAEFNLLTSKLGRLAMSASLIAEFQAVILSVLFNSFYYGTTIMNTLSFLLYFCAFITFVWLLARPLAIWIIRRTPGGSEIDETYFLVVVLLALGSSIIGDIIGETPMAGPLLLGLLLPGGPPLGTALVDRLDGLVSSVFLPVFFAVAGLRTNFHEFSNNKVARQSNGYSNWSRAGYLIIVGTLGKFTGVIIPCIFCKIPLRDAFILALILNCHGVVEISSFNNWEDYEEADGEVYSVSILALVVVGGTCGALLKALYGPSARFSGRRRRTVQGLGHIGELRMLTCVHGEESVPPLLEFIDVIYPSAVSPICIYLLHLYPLVGQCHATLALYKGKRCRESRSFSNESASDRIVNSFRELERHFPPGRAVILPFIGVSPYATMHDDICSLSQDKMVDLVLLPFHRRINSGVSFPDTVNPAVRGVNTSVLLYAPCTVAILVDREFSCGPVYVFGTTHRVAAFFIGGGDDREALSLATRMLDNSAIDLTVFRFVLPKEMAGLDGAAEEEGLDNDAMEQFLIRHEGRERVGYQEVEVREGAETVAAIKTMSENCSLILVGRGETRMSPATSGLEMWREFPELGVVGDILASPNFGCKASVLVVQHPASSAPDVSEVKLPASRFGSCRKMQAKEDEQSADVEVEEIRDADSVRLMYGKQQRSEY